MEHENIISFYRASWYASKKEEGQKQASIITHLIHLFFPPNHRSISSKKERREKKKKCNIFQSIYAVQPTLESAKIINVSTANLSRHL